MNSIKFIQGNCIDKIKELKDNSIDCVVSSPPYFGLRDYGTAKWEGGDPNCDHIYAKHKSRYDYDLSKAQTGTHAGAKKGTDQAKWDDICPNCGAKRIDEQFGLEKTYQDYIANTVKVFETFKPKLKDTATIWWNVGDSYASFRAKGTSDNGQGKSGLKGNRYSEHLKLKEGFGRSGTKSIYGTNTDFRGRGKISGFLKPKDLIMIPNRVAIALQDAGWYIRSEIIWHKPNPMPESTKDRPTSSHEKIWMITKNKKYYYDADAIKEKSKYAGDNRGSRSDLRRGTKMNSVSGTTPAYRNKRNVWTITTKPFRDAHFATFPKDLIEPCIKAGCPEGGVVLDPFSGAGTTGVVAVELKRKAVLIELNPDYIKIAKNRMDKEFGLFVDA